MTPITADVQPRLVEPLAPPLESVPELLDIETQSQACIDAALQRLVKSTRWLELDRRALQKGRELFREQFVHTTA